jgi:hypothetical protein
LVHHPVLVLLLLVMILMMLLIGLLMSVMMMMLLLLLVVMVGRHSVLQVPTTCVPVRVSHHLRDQHGYRLGVSTLTSGRQVTTEDHNR